MKTTALKRWAVILGTVLCVGAAAATVAVPKNALQYLPVLKVQIGKIWPSKPPHPEYFAAQVEQESCVSLTSKGCWNPHTELKTSREYGFGLGQITIAYDAKGKERFNNYRAMVDKYSELRNWKWDDRYNPAYQIDALLLMDKESFVAASRLTSSVPDQYSFMFSAYNGGLGGLIQDRKLCTTIKGCDPSKWYGNVELHSFKSKTKFKGYGQSAFEINRGYVKNIEQVRSPKYVPYFVDEPASTPSAK